MLVTIVTTTYNNFQNIFKCIDSVLNQSYPNIEYIITDDGSRSFPEEDIRNFIENRRKNNLEKYSIIHHKKNLGTVKNLNYSYKFAKGDIIIPLSSDDVFYNNDIVQLIVNEFLKQKCNILVTSREVINEDNKFLCLLPHVLERNSLNKMSHKTQYDRFMGKRIYDLCSGSCLCIKTKFIHEFGFFDEKYYLYEDAPFFAKYLKKYKLNLALNIISIKYRIGGISTSKKINPILSQDMYLFNKSKRNENLSKFSFITKQKINYDITYQEICNNKYKKIELKFLRLKYLPICIYYMFYKYIRKIYGLVDIFYI